MKKLLTGIWIILIIAFLILFINYQSNEKMISNYNDGEYSQNTLSFLGFTEPYIAPYNQGDIYYQQGDYEKALEQYEKALLLHPTQERECKIRINIALCMVMPIEIDKVTADEVDEVIETLETAKDVLLEHGCAHEEDSNGHNEDAQKLKEDIDELEKKLKNQEDPNSEQNNPSDPQPSDPEIDDQNIKEQLQELQDQGIKDRLNELEKIEHLYDFDYYSGASW